MLSRVKLGFAPSTLSAPVLLAQDIDGLNAQFRSNQASLADLLAASGELEIEAKRLKMPETIARILLQRGEILSSCRRYAEALTALAEADEVLGPARQQDMKVMICAALADTHSLLQAWDAVLCVCRQGIALVEQYRYQVSAQYLQSSYLRARISLYAHGVRAAYELGEYDLMLEWAELSKCRSVLRQQSQTATTTEDVDQLEGQFRNVCRQIDEARKAGNQAALTKLLPKRRTLWDLLVIQRSRSQTAAFPSYDLAAIQAELAGDEAILYYYWLDGQTLLIAVLDSRQLKPILRLLTVAEQQALLRYAEIVLEALTPEMPGYLAHVDKARTFADLLLPAEIIAIVEKKRRLLISPHQLLHALPFQVLPWDEAHSYLIQRFAITYIPNLTSLLLAYQKSTNRNRSLLTIGVSDFNRHNPKHPALPEAAQEAAELEVLYGRHGFFVQTLLDRKATANGLHELEQTGKLAELSCLHISTHGHNVNSDTPMESYLLLFDSLLDGLEIVNCRLGAEVTVLSACCSGQRPFRGRMMAQLPGDDLFGLQAAFFAAGSRRILGSLWPVDATIAHKIIMAFHRHLANDVTPETALQAVIVEHINQARSRLRKSYFWASFFLSAVGRPYGQYTTSTLSKNRYQIKTVAGRPHRGGEYG